MTRGQKIKSDLQKELVEKGFDHKILRIYWLAPGKKAIQLDRPFTSEVLWYFNAKFENGITTHEYFVFSINNQA